jgi:hypothetical protein
MGSLAATQLIALLLAVAALGSITGFIASAAIQRKKRHARRFLALGFVCGLMAGAVLRRRLRSLMASQLRAALLGLIGHRRPAPATGVLTRMTQNLSPRR